MILHLVVALVHIHPRDLQITLDLLLDLCSNSKRIIMSYQYINIRTMIPISSFFFLSSFLFYTFFASSNLEIHVLYKLNISLNLDFHVLNKSNMTSNLDFNVLKHYKSSRTSNI